jgi:hypothetical protein
MILNLKNQQVRGSKPSAACQQHISDETLARCISKIKKIGRE